MATKTSLSAALKQVAGASSAAPLPVADEPAATNAPTGRQGKKAVTGFFAPAVSRQLRQIAADTDTTIQELLREALNDLFAKHGRERLA
jgi:hypothetical protein